MIKNFILLGTIMYAEVKIGDSIIMVSDSTLEWKPTSCALYLYVDDTGKRYEKTLEYGTTSLMEPRDEGYDDRCAGVIDRFGNQWGIATRKENLTGEDINNSSDNHMDESQTFSI
jgi:PhnB protein